MQAAQEVRSNPRASARERFEKKFSLGGQRQVSQKKSGIRTQELQNMRARSLSENPGQASAREISAGIPDSLAPELLRLLTSEFWNVESGTPSSFREVAGGCIRTSLCALLSVTVNRLEVGGLQRFDLARLRKLRNYRSRRRRAHFCPARVIFNQLT